MSPGGLFHNETTLMLCCCSINHVRDLTFSAAHHYVCVCVCTIAPYIRSIVTAGPGRRKNDYCDVTLIDRKTRSVHIVVRKARDSWAFMTQFISCSSRIGMVCTSTTFWSLMVALMMSRLDYGNSVLTHLVRRLQSVQNATAWLIGKLRRFDHNIRTSK